MAAHGSSHRAREHRTQGKKKKEKLERRRTCFVWRCPDANRRGAPPRQPANYRRPRLPVASAFPSRGAPSRAGNFSGRVIPARLAPHGCKLRETREVCLPPSARAAEPCASSSRSSPPVRWEVAAVLGAGSREFGARRGLRCGTLTIVLAAFRIRVWCFLLGSLLARSSKFDTTFARPGFVLATRNIPACM